MENKIKLTAKEKIQIEEIKRRRKEFQKGKIMATLAFPNEVKTLVEKGILTPYSKELPRVLNWYNLTELGAKITHL